MGSLFTQCTGVEARRAIHEQLCLDVQSSLGGPPSAHASRRRLFEAYSPSILVRSPRTRITQSPVLSYDTLPVRLTANLLNNLQVVLTRQQQL